MNVPNWTLRTIACAVVVNSVGCNQDNVPPGATTCVVFPTDSGAAGAGGSAAHVGEAGPTPLCGPSVGGANGFPPIGPPIFNAGGAAGTPGAGGSGVTSSTGGMGTMGVGGAPEPGGSPGLGGAPPPGGSGAPGLGGLSP